MSLLLTKMSHRQGEVMEYALGDLDLNQAMGRNIHISHTGRIVCLHCGTDIKKTYGDGYCYPCFSTLARTDSCIIKPHTCHYQQGTCREPEWGEAHCLVPHVVYLALTSDVKVGVTGAERILERWGDQGAVEAVVLARTPDRLTAGRIEKSLSNHMPDRTNWRKLVTSWPEPVDLLDKRQKAGELVAKKYQSFLCTDDTVECLNYPVSHYPEKARSVNLAKAKNVCGILEGIRGQYLIIADQVFNVRRHSGHEVDIKIS